jgi:hypothetical protein
MSFRTVVSCGYYGGTSTLAGSTSIAERGHTYTGSSIYIGMPSSFL